MARSKKQMVDPETPVDLDEELEENLDEEEEISLEMQKEQLEKKLSVLQKEKADLSLKIDRLIREIDVIIIKSQGTIDRHKTAKDLREYLDSQQALREKQAKDLAELGLNYQTPLAKAFARKTSFGVHRPSREN